jgi:L-fucose isomerase-like protein
MGKKSKIGLITLVSDMHDPGKTTTAMAPLPQLKAFFHITEIPPEHVHAITEDIPVVFIKTGGTEHKFKALFPALKASGKPITLLSSGTDNSLPAALEIKYWLALQGMKNVLLLHGPVDSIREKLTRRCECIRIQQSLKQSKAGVLGKPSDWLIASQVDYGKVKEKWGIQLLDIPLEEVVSNVHQVSPSEVKQARRHFPAPGGVCGPSEKDVEGAIKIYLAVRKIQKDYGLTALTVRCFDLLESLNNTGCLALAKLNDEGIPAGCEGDIPALVTMIINQLLTGQPGFMVNPSVIAGDSILFAHCTVPMTLVESFALKTHFESGRGVAIAGTFSPSPVTITKIMGIDLQQYFALQGRIVAHTPSHRLCRTQVKVIPDQPPGYFLENALGNHHIMGKGHYGARFETLMAFLKKSNDS